MIAALEKLKASHEALPQQFAASALPTAKSRAVLRGADESSARWKSASLPCAHSPQKFDSCLRRR